MISIYLAYVMGAFFLVIGLAILLHVGRYQQLMKQCVANKVLLMYEGSINLIFSLMIVTAHNYWDPDWYLAITLIGWLILLKSLLRLFFPEHDLKLTKRCISKEGALSSGWVMTIVGAFLLIMGFYNG